MPLDLYCVSLDGLELGLYLLLHDLILVLVSLILGTIFKDNCWIFCDNQTSK